MLSFTITPPIDTLPEPSQFKSGLWYISANKLLYYCIRIEKELYLVCINIAIARPISYYENDSSLKLIELKSKLEITI